MRIIKPGERISIISDCPTCRCEFEYNLKELEVKKLGIFGNIYYVRCPNCGICEEINLSEILSIIENKEAVKEIIKEKKRGKKNGI